MKMPLLSICSSLSVFLINSDLDLSPSFPLPASIWLRRQLSASSEQ